MVTGQELPEGYLKIPDRINMAAWVVDRHVTEGRGDNTAVVAEQRSYTFEALRQLSNRAGNALRQLGVGRGDHVLLRLGTNLQCMVAILGAMKIGAVPIPSSTLLREHEIEIILENSDAVAAVSTPELVGPIEAIQARRSMLECIILVGGDGELAWERLLDQAATELTPEPMHRDEPAYMLYTSGTTGEPKGVEHAHRWIIATGDPVANVMMRLGPEDICFQPQDWSFIYPLACNFLFPFHAGATVVLPHGRFEAEEVLATIERHRVTVFCAVPTIYRMMLAVPAAESRFRLDSLRIGVSAGEPLPADTWNEWRERFGVTIYDGLGQSESHIFVANRIGMPIKPGSMGKPLPGYEVAILNDEGEPQPVGEPGRLVIRNDHPGLALGYRKHPELWAAVNQGGWYDTKDFASVDEEGYYWYVSRADDLIKSRAYLISPKEVESAILEHPAVLETGVVGIPDQLMGQRVTAYVTLKASHTASADLAEEIRQHTRQLIAPYKAPQEVAFVAELPKTATGKILRRELRAKG
ncbi:MAG: benzoate-CoA ligase family protein [Acidimicrobiia bacterium]